MEEEEYKNLKRMAPSRCLIGNVYTDDVEEGKEYIFVGDPRGRWKSYERFPEGCKVICIRKDITDGVHYYESFGGLGNRTGFLKYLCTNWLHDPTDKNFVTTVSKTTGELTREFN